MLELKVSISWNVHQYNLLSVMRLFLFHSASDQEQIMSGDVLSLVTTALEMSAFFLIVKFIAKGQN